MILSRRSPLPAIDCCRLLGLSRASLYREPTAKVVEGASEIVALAGAHPRFGYRRLALLANVSEKRMRTRVANLGLGVKRKIRRKRTTFPVPMDAMNLCAPPHGCGELLVSDFTYIPLQRGFAYFAITLDAFSRRIRGWSFAKTMDNRFVVEAMNQAAASGELAKGWVHHSDRGCQYASAEFRGLVHELQGAISFSKPATPADNAFAESFFARFKDEVVRTSDDLDYEQAKALTAAYVEFYNHKRPHSSLGNRSPVTFEAAHAGRDLELCVS